MLNNIYKKLIISLCLYCIMSLEAISAPPDIQNYLSTEDDFENQIDEFSSDLEDFFIQNERYDYSVSYGIARFTEDTKSSEYMTALQIAYNQALFSAYYSMALSLSDNGPTTTTESNDDLSASRNYAKQKAIRDCRADAFYAYDSYKKEILIKKQKKLEEENSLLGIVKDSIKSDEKKTEERIAEQNKIDEEKRDFIYKCKTSGDYQEFTETTSTNLNDVISGARIWISPAVNKQIAVVIVKSNETSALAGMLKNNRGINISRPLETAKIEIRSRIKEEVLSNTAFPESLLGLRAMKLSNGEWAVYAYGLSLNERNQGAMQSVADSAAKSVSINRAFNALSKFSSLMIDQNNVTKEIKGSSIDYEIFYNATKDTFKVKVINNESLATVAEVFNSSSSSLELPNSKDIFKRKINHNNASYRLTAVAWSPSLASVNQTKRSYNDSYNKNPSSLNENNENNENKPRYLKQDW